MSPLLDVWPGCRPSILQVRSAAFRAGNATHKHAHEMHDALESTTYSQILPLSDDIFSLCLFKLIYHYQQPLFIKAISVEKFMSNTLNLIGLSL